MAMPERSRAIGIARFAALSLTTIVVVTVSFGWLYLLQGPTMHWPGPKVSDALVLDELAGHSSVPLVVFLFAICVGAFVIAGLARALHFDGIQIALVTGAIAALWLYLASSISISVVRQVPIDDALRAARGLESVYLAASSVAIAIAIMATRPTGENTLTRFIPGCVALLGMLDFLVGTLPRSVDVNRPVIGIFTGPISPGGRTIEITVGVLLILCARALSRRSRRAVWFAVLLTIVSLATRLVDGFSVSTIIICALVALMLLTRRHDFVQFGDPTTRYTPLIRFVSMVVLTIVYGVFTLFIYRSEAGLTFHLASALRATLRTLVLSAPPQATLLSGEFAEWFPWTLRLIVGSGAIWGAVAWFAPWHQRLEDEGSRFAYAREVVGRWGTDSLAPFTLRKDKAHFFFPEDSVVAIETTLIAFRVLRGVAIVSGDPIGPKGGEMASLASFLEMCNSKGWIAAIIGASDRYLPGYHELGLRTLYQGDEAVVDIDTFTLEGGAMKSVRQAAQRLARKGFTAEPLLASQLSRDDRDALTALETQWLAGQRRKGFVMELDSLFRLDGDEELFVVGRGPSGEVVGFLEIAICPASRSLSLSSMPRVSEAPNGLNAYLIVTAVNWAREHGFTELSLNFSPVARLLTGDITRTPWSRLARRVLLVIKRLFRLQLDNLYVFNRQFLPRWQPRYLVFKRRRDLGRIILAAMAAERYLPFADVLRGRNWDAHPVRAKVSYTSLPE